MSQATKWHGIDCKWWQQITAICNEFPSIERIALYGSRAKNTFHSGSDIDLAIFARDLSQSDFFTLSDRLRQLPIAFGLDIVHWDSLQNNALKDKISLEAVTIDGGS
jgi:proline iminopeptidase